MPKKFNTIKLTKGYWLERWVDFDSATEAGERMTECVSILHSEGDKIEGICFAFEEDDTWRVTVNDHGLIPEQYLTPPHLYALRKINLIPGMRFPSLDHLWEFAKLNAKYKKPNDLE